MPGRRGWTVVCLVAICLGGAATSSAEPEEKQRVRGEIHSLAGQTPPSPAELLSAQSTFLSSQTEEEREAADVATADVIGRIYDVLHAEFDTPEHCEAFARQWDAVENRSVLTRYGSFVDVFLPAADADAYVELDGAEGLVWVEQATRMLIPPPLPSSLAPPGATRSLPERIVRGGYKDATGKRWTGRGTIVAIVDDGLDFRHPAFCRQDASGRETSRLLWYWDPTVSPEEATKAIDGKAVLAPPVHYPNGGPIGVVYTQAFLTKALAAPASQTTGPLRDYLGGSHGTQCASVAAGNGRGSDARGRNEPYEYYAGVAPEADLIAVRIAQDKSGPSHTYLLNAICGWLDERATERGQPLVVSCSFGGVRGGCDGATIEERQLAARFADDKAGRALVCAAGNHGRERWHADLVTPGDDNWRDGILEWQLGQVRGALLDVYIDTDQADDIEFSTLTIAQGPEPKVELVLEYVNPITKDYVLKFEVASDGALAFWSLSGTEHQLHAYVHGRERVQDASGRERLAIAEFTDTCVSWRSMLSHPASCQAAIAVGSYDFNDNVYCGKRPNGVAHFATLRPEVTVGALSDYSSPGPLRTGSVKPTLAAPGSLHVSAYPVVDDPDVAWDVIPPAANRCTMVGELNSAFTPNRRYSTWQGTSSATPYTAGVVALMFEKDPTLTVLEVRQHLVGGLSKENLRGPENGWGFGKLDHHAVGRILQGLKR